MKKVLVVSAAAAVLLALSAYQSMETVESKGHVSIKKTQVCHDGDPVEVITVSINALPAHLNHGDCRLPTCDFNNGFDTEDLCEISNPGENCNVANSRDDACGVTRGRGPRLRHLRNEARETRSLAGDDG